MLKNISNLKGAQELSKNEQKSISGGKACFNPSHQACSNVVGCPVNEICLLDTITQNGICICRL